MDCFPSHLCTSPPWLLQRIDGCLEGARGKPFLVAIFFPRSSLGKEMWQPNKTYTNRPCVFTLCLYAVPQPGVLPSSYPPTPPAKKDKPKQPQAPLPSSTPVPPLFSSECWQTQKEAKKQSLGASPHECAEIKPRRWWSRPERGEGWGGGFEERNRSGCYSADKIQCPLPLSQRQLGRGVASYAFLLSDFLSAAHVFNESIVWAGGRIWGPIWLSLTCKKSVAVTADGISGL